MSDHRHTEVHFRRVENILHELINCTDPEAHAILPPSGKSAQTLRNDLTICLKNFIQRPYASVLLTPEKAREWNYLWVIYADNARNVVRCKRRQRATFLSPMPLEVRVAPTETGTHQLSLRVDILSDHGRRLAHAAATLLAANYLVCPQGFIGHCDDALERELRELYPAVTVLRDTDNIHGNITLIL